MQHLSLSKHLINDVIAARHVDVLHTVHRFIEGVTHSVSAKAVKCSCYFEIVVASDSWTVHLVHVRTKNNIMCWLTNRQPSSVNSITCSSSCCLAVAMCDVRVAMHCCASDDGQVVPIRSTNAENHSCDAMEIDKTLDVKQLERAWRI